MNIEDSDIISELKKNHELNLQLYTGEDGCYLEPDWKLLNAFETVLEYYMTKEEYQKWHKEIGLQKLTTMGVLMGEY